MSNKQSHSRNPYESSHSNSGFDYSIFKTDAKGSFEISLDKNITDDKNPYIATENAINKKKYAKKSLVFAFVCLALSVAVNFMSFHFPLTPSIVRTDFSVIFELLAALAVHPVAGVAVVIAKSAVCLFIRPESLPSVMNKAILDIIFIVIVCLVYKLLLNPEKIERKNLQRVQNGLDEKDYSNVTTLFAGVIGSLITAAVSALTVRFIMFPTLFHYFANVGYTPQNVLLSYQWAFDGLCSHLPVIRKLIPSLDTLTEGILVYNVPLAVFKYFVSTVLSTVLCIPANQILNKK